jgi:hypothetical protein
MHKGKGKEHREPKDIGYRETMHDAPFVDISRYAQGK